MLSTLSQPAGAELALKEADQVLDILDPNEFQTQLLREDNRKMKADREVWRVKKGLVGQDIEGVAYGEDQGYPAEHFELDRELEEKLRLEVLEEMPPSRKPDVEMTEDSGKATDKTGIPSPTSSEG
jgi:hypothetical protein